MHREAARLLKEEQLQRLYRTWCDMLARISAADGGNGGNGGNGGRSGQAAVAAGVGRPAVRRASAASGPLGGSEQAAAPGASQRQRRSVVFAPAAAAGGELHKPHRSASAGVALAPASGDQPQPARAPARPTRSSLSASSSAARRLPPTAPPASNGAAAPPPPAAAFRGAGEYRACDDPTFRLGVLERFVADIPRNPLLALEPLLAPPASEREGAGGRGGAAEPPGPAAGAARVEADAFARRLAAQEGRAEARVAEGEERARRRRDAALKRAARERVCSKLKEARCGRRGFPPVASSAPTTPTRACT